MKPNLFFKDPLENYTNKCHLALLLLVFLSVSFFNVAHARHQVSHDKTPYFSDWVCVAESCSEADSDDQYVDFASEATTSLDKASSHVVVRNTTHNLNYYFLRPHTRAPPKIFI